MYNGLAVAPNIYIWDLISVDDYCKEISEQYNIELHKIRGIALKVLLEAKVEKTDDFSIAQSINDSLVQAGPVRTRV